MILSLKKIYEKISTFYIFGLEKFQQTKSLVLHKSSRKCCLEPGEYIADFFVFEGGWKNSYLVM
jgi:hypothetical protein